MTNDLLEQVARAIEDAAYRSEYLDQEYPMKAEAKAALAVAEPIIRKDQRMKDENRFIPLYRAVNEMMAVLGYHGEISTDDGKVKNVMEALYILDGGDYDPKAKQLREQESSIDMSDMTMAGSHGDPRIDGK